MRVRHHHDVIPKPKFIWVRCIHFIFKQALAVLTSGRVLCGVILGLLVVFEGNEDTIGFLPVKSGLGAVDVDDAIAVFVDPSHLLSLFKFL